MNIVSLNIRGIGDRAKRRQLPALIRRGNFDIVCIQENERETLEDAMVRNLWGHQSFEWFAKPSVGASGGILLSWKAGLFEVKSCFSGTGFVGLCCKWQNMLIYVVNVYAPCSTVGKKEAWDAMLAVKQHGDQGEWCVVGDFNAVSSLNEHQGNSAHLFRADTTEFNSFISDMDLVDVLVYGKEFTWFCSDGLSRSRLDRFLLSDGLISSWKINGQWVGDRDISDHCPIWLLRSSKDWGLKPFRVFNGWLEHPDFNHLVEQWWEGFLVRGKKGYVIKEKMKMLKAKLKVWNKEVFGQVKRFK